MNALLIIRRVVWVIGLIVVGALLWGIVGEYQTGAPRLDVVAAYIVVAAWIIVMILYAIKLERNQEI